MIVDGHLYDSRLKKILIWFTGFFQFDFFHFWNRFLKLKAFSYKNLQIKKKDKRGKNK